LARIEDVQESVARVDAQVRAVLGRVLAQRRSAEAALAYVTALAPGTRANCWSLAEAAGHEGWGRMQALLRSYVWDWKDLRAELAGLAAAWLPDREDDLIGPGIAIDETADLKKGDGTVILSFAVDHGCDLGFRVADDDLDVAVAALWRVRLRA